MFASGGCHPPPRPAATPSAGRAAIGLLALIALALTACEVESTGDGPGDDAPDADVLDGAIDAAPDDLPDGAPDVDRGPPLSPDICHGDACDCAEAALAGELNTCNARRLAATPDGGFVAVGTRDFRNAWVARFTADGRARWSRTPPDVRRVHAAVALPGGDLFVAGLGAAPPDDDACPPPWLARLDPDGRIVWQRTQPECGVAYHAAVRGDGVVVIAVSSNAQWIRGIDPTDGETLWSTLFGNDDDAVRSLIIDADDIAHVSGQQETGSATPESILARYAPDGERFVRDILPDADLSIGWLDPDGARLHVALDEEAPYSRTRLERVEPDGSMLWSISTEMFGPPGAIASVADGAVFATDDEAWHRDELPLIYGISSDGALRFVRRPSAVERVERVRLAALTDGRLAVAVHDPSSSGARLTFMEPDGTGPGFEQHCAWPQRISTSEAHSLTIHVREDTLYAHHSQQFERRQGLQRFTKPYERVLSLDGHRRDPHPILADTDWAEARLFASASVEGGWLFGGQSGRAWAARVDFDGTVRWALSEEHAEGLEDVYGILITSDGGWAIAATWAVVPDGQQGSMGRVMRFDADGALLWSEDYGGPPYNRIRLSFDPMSDGGFLLTGVFYADGRPYVARLGPDGELLWTYEAPEQVEAWGTVRALPLEDGAVALFEERRIVRLRDGEVEAVVFDENARYTAAIVEDGGFAVLERGGGLNVLRLDAALEVIERLPVPPFFEDDPFSAHGDGKALAVSPEGYVVATENASGYHMTVVTREGEHLCTTLP